LYSALPAGKPEELFGAPQTSKDSLIMRANSSIEPGKKYLVRQRGVQLQVTALRPSSSIRGWWACVSEQGDRSLFPEAAFVTEIIDLSVCNASDERRAG
jgi:hypothetical protein